jgi:hypothetical protein
LTPKDIEIHPDWDILSNRYDADIGIIHLDEIKLSDKIHPVCVWQNAAAETQFVNKNGIVVGYGTYQADIRKNSDVPQKIAVPIVANNHCYLESDLSYIASNRTFCAGARDLSGPCL